MADVSNLRADVTRSLYANLKDREFRARLEAVDQDGDYPLVVVLPDDLMRDVIGKLHSVGGNGSLVMPKAGGFMVVSMIHTPLDEMVATCGHSPADLTPDCTVGAFFARVFSDGDEGGAYQFMDDAGTVQERGHAELVAVGR